MISIEGVSAWCHQNQLVFGQEKVNSKSNEITVIPKVLDLLDFANKVITIDALGAQREICQKIVGAKGDYVILLTGNQKTLHNAVKLYLSDSKNHEIINENNDKGHDRLEQRIAIVAHDIGWLNELHDWPALMRLGRKKPDTISLL